MKRKLTGIFYADVAGYSRLTGADEEGTHFALTAHLATLTAAIDAHGGRICHFAGDAVLAEFSSVVDALECAVDAQRDLAERDKGVPENRRLRFRIGVNLGDVMVEGAEIYGNGVNVAARLEALADPGGICVSERVFEQVENNVDVGFAFLGTHKVKNIGKPVHAYKVLLDPKFAGKTFRTAGRLGWRWMAAAAVLILIAALGGGAIWLRPSAPDVKSTIVEHMAIPLTDKPSIAVLPFDTLSGDRRYSSWPMVLRKTSLPPFRGFPISSSSPAIPRSPTRTSR